MALKLITPATQAAVTLDEAKLQARVDGTTAMDAAITAYILAATEMAEQATGRAIMPQTWELTLDEFPDAFKLTRVPASSIVSIKYFDATGTQQTLSNTLYALDNADEFGCAYVVPVYAGSWPSTRDQINAVSVRYVAGWPDAASVPPVIKSWILLMVAAMVDNPSAVSDRQTFSLGFADRLLDRHKVWEL